jgi:hypothetical protein
MKVSRIAALLIVACAIAAVLISSPREMQAQSACPSSGTYGRDVGRDFFAEVVDALSDVRQNNFAVDALAAWAPYESTKAFWNPLATTWRLQPVCYFNCLRRNTNGQCTSGVQNYTSQDDGVTATANTLNLSYYASIRAMLDIRDFDREAMRKALGTWGTCKGARCDALLNTWDRLYAEYQSAGTGGDSGSEILSDGGGLDLSGYCQSLGFEGATLTEQNAYGWACQARDGGTSGMDLFDACRWQYEGALPTPRYADFSDPFGWKCYRQ